MVRRAVRADDARPVEREDDRQVHEADVVHDLVVGALQERGVDRAHRPEALRREAGGEEHGVLLADAHVEGAAGNLFAKRSMPVPSAIAAVTPTTRGSFSAASESASANTAV